jgi:hypothetical protein
LIERSVLEGASVGTPEPGYRWSCGMCHDLRLIEDLEEYGMLADCPKCETVYHHGVAFELVRRNMTPTISTTERLASPAGGAPSFVYEVWEFFIEEGTARRVAVEDDVGTAYIAKWDFEEAAYGPREQRMGP